MNTTRTHTHTHKSGQVTPTSNSSIGCSTPARHKRQAAQVTYVSRNVIMQVPVQAILQAQVFMKPLRDFKIPKRCIKSTMHYENVSKGVQNVYGKCRGDLTAPGNLQYGFANGSQT